MKKLKNILAIFLALLVPVMLCACKKNKVANVELPSEIKLTNDNGQPLLKLYDTSTKSISEITLEDYLVGVVAGEIHNDWPIEAIKAQAILARSYTLYYLKNYKSKYAGADISNDVTEAQAYNTERINDNIKKAVADTKGLIVSCDGEPVEAWFHSNSGGVTTTAKNGLNFMGEENYTKSVTSPENKNNSQDYEWNCTFKKSEVLSALRAMGVSVSSINSFAVGEKDSSGRATTFKVGGAEISANTFRIKIGSTKLKSTLINNIIVSSNSIYFAGRGYGHGVGLSQWGAKILADEGKTAEEIIKHYFNNVSVQEYKVS